MWLLINIFELNFPIGQIAFIVTMLREGGVTSVWGVMMARRLDFIVKIRGRSRCATRTLPSIRDRQRIRSHLFWWFCQLLSVLTCCRLRSGPSWRVKCVHCLLDWRPRFQCQWLDYVLICDRGIVNVHDLSAVGDCHAWDLLCIWWMFRYLSHYYQTVNYTYVSPAVIII